jgi:sugar phosphate isomerase/epimerase
VTHEGPALWWGSLEGADLPTLVACAGRAGFAEVSTTPAMYFAARAAGASDADLRVLLADNGVVVSVIDPLLRGLPGACAPERVGRRWRSTFEHDEDDCHVVADALGAAVINVAHFLGAPTSMAELVDAIGAITERAARRGRAIAIEAMPEGFIPDLATALAIVRGIAHPMCGLTLDTWHWWRSGGLETELEALAAGEVLVLQVSDALVDVRGTGTEPPVRDRLLPGQGDIPLVDLLRSVRAANPHVRVGLEVFDAAVADMSFEVRAATARRAHAELERRVATLS